MITEFFLNIIFNLVSGCLVLVPEIDFNIDSGVFQLFLDFVDLGCYLLPMRTVASILELVIALAVFRVIIATVRTVWDLLPLV